MAPRRGWRLAKYAKRAWSRACRTLYRDDHRDQVDDGLGNFLFHICYPNATRQSGRLRLTLYML